MKLYWSPRSPFVRKVMVVAHETGQADRIEIIRSVVAMSEPNPELMRVNPLSKIPTLVLDDGTVLQDSSVICEYLDTLNEGPRLFPAAGQARWAALKRHALGSGLLDLLIIWRNERDRPAELQSAPHLAAYAVKAHATFDALERDVEALTATPFGIGHIAIGCALSYSDFRFPNEDWRKGHDRLARWHEGFAARPSARATEPRDA